MSAVMVLVHQEIPEEVYRSNADLELKHSSNLMDYISLPNSELFPIPLGSDLRQLGFLKHKFEGEFSTLRRKDQLISTAFSYLNVPYLCFCINSFNHNLTNA